jgi:hypothetical protein
MRIAGETERLDDPIEMDDSYLGSERSGGRTDHVSFSKKPIVVVVQTSDGERPRRMKLCRTTRFEPLTRIAIGAVVADAGCKQVSMATCFGRRSARHPAFRWVNTMLGTIKTSIAGTYCASRKKQMVRCLVEFEWRFNHRPRHHDPGPRLRRGSQKPATSNWLTLVRNQAGH